MNEKKVSLRYARAIFDLAKELDITDKVLYDFDYINKVIESSDQFKAFLGNPIINPNKKIAVINALFSEKTTDLSIKMLKIITEKGREILIPSIAKQYEAIYNEVNNRLPVKIISAKQLNENQKVNILSKLKLWLNKEILPDYKVDKDIIGGIKFSFSDKIIDSSVKNQLEKIKSNMILNS